ncbi:MAG: type II toxin-antitoxin system VapC family toxin [Deltaproteobacteria bacterium]|nr:type II toxin-antitoxin system VapC family toxin [Deltaproteobacteria bacterium]
MKVLLDTHALLWWLFDDPGMSKVARDVIADPGNTILVSSASAWEIATKHRLGKLPEAGEAATNLGGLLRKARMTELPISVDHALAAGALPRPPRDPFDRMLIAQARLEGLPVVTLDPIFGDYRVPVVW